MASWSARHRGPGALCRRRRARRSRRRDRRRRRAGPAHRRRQRSRRGARLHRHPHALRRAGLLGPDAQPFAVARCHDRDRRQLRVHASLRSPPPTATTSCACSPGSRGCRSSRCRQGAPLGLDDDGRVPSDRLDGTLVPNAGFLVGHSALRRAMHDDAVGQQATPAQIDAMKRCWPRAAAGGLGFSSTWSRSHNDHGGNPRAFPPRHAGRAPRPLLGGARPSRHHAGVHPRPSEFDDDTFATHGCMSGAANRPLNWNVLIVYAKNRDVVDHQLTGSDIAAAEGGRVVALTLPDSLRQWINFKSGFVFDVLPGWGALMARPDDEKLAMMSDPRDRRRWTGWRSRHRARPDHRQLGGLCHRRDVHSGEPPLRRDSGRRGRHLDVAPWSAGRHRRGRRTSHRRVQAGHPVRTMRPGLGGWRCGGIRVRSSAAPTPAPTST